MNWTNDIPTSVEENRSFCIKALVAPCCVAYDLRKRAVDITNTQYTCCGGVGVCANRLNEHQNPRFWNIIESSCCMFASIYGTRKLLMRKYVVNNGKRDNCILAPIMGMEYVITGLRTLTLGEVIFLPITLIVQRFHDIVSCFVCACVQTQHEDFISKKEEVRFRAKYILKITAPVLENMEA